MTTYTIDFEPVGRRGECQRGESLLDCAHRLGVGISSICVGKGTCHTCKVQVLSGAASRPTSNELEVFTSQELKDGWRLACQTYPTSDCKLAVPPESMTHPQRIQVEGLEITVQPEPPVHAYPLRLTPPSLSAPHADVDRLLDALNRKNPGICKSVDIEVVRDLSPKLRSWDWSCSVFVRGEEIVSIAPRRSQSLGLAVDLGSTKIAGYLVDLTTGRTLTAKGMMNPQVGYGEDIITRINYVITSPIGGKEMQDAVLGAIMQIASDLCKEVDAKPQDIVESVIVGNTAMHHLLLRLPVRQLVFSPFVPAVSRALDVKARDIGLNIAPGAYVHILPNIAGFVGADHVAMLLATEVRWKKGIIIAIDIGTNTEISLVKNGQIMSASCASGPAFEGYHIKNGVRASKGAIERVRITSDSVQYETIDGASPIGICGSGILDAMAQLFLSGIVDQGGKMIKDSHPRLQMTQGQPEFVLVTEEEGDGRPKITITQRDIRELQLAKAAIRASIQILLEQSKVSERQIDRVIIAGAFGSYIDVSNSIAIGMLPSLPRDHFEQVGNAAGVGAKLALISMSRRAMAKKLREKVRYVELATSTKFQKIFTQACYIGPYQGPRRH